MAVGRHFCNDKRMPSFYVMATIAIFMALCLIGMWMLSSPSGDEVVPKGSAGDVEQETQQKVEESPHTKSYSTNDGLEAGEEKKEPQPLDIEEKKVPEAEPDIEKLVADVQVDHEEVKETSEESTQEEQKGSDLEESGGAQSEIQGETKENPDEEVGFEEEPKKEKDAAKKAGSEGKSDFDEWTLCGSEGAADYIPCLDNKEVIKNLPSTKHYEHRKRHCPSSPPTCLVPLPQGYHTPVPWRKSQDEVWFSNVPHLGLVSYKKDQNWVKKSGDKLIFPGGGTQFKHGASPHGVDLYIDEHEGTLALSRESSEHLMVIGLVDLVTSPLKEKDMSQKDIKLTSKHFSEAPGRGREVFTPMRASGVVDAADIEALNDRSPIPTDFVLMPGALPELKTIRGKAGDSRGVEIVLSEEQWIDGISFEPENQNHFLVENSQTKLYDAVLQAKKHLQQLNQHAVALEKEKAHLEWTLRACQSGLEEAKLDVDNLMLQNKEIQGKLTNRITSFESAQLVWMKEKDEKKCKLLTSEHSLHELQQNAIVLERQNLFLQSELNHFKKAFEKEKQDVLKLRKSKAAMDLDYIGCQQMLKVAQDNVVQLQKGRDTLARELITTKESLEKHQGQGMMLQKTIDELQNNLIQFKHGFDNAVEKYSVVEQERDNLKAAQKEVIIRLEQSEQRAWMLENQNNAYETLVVELKRTFEGAQKQVIALEGEKEYLQSKLSESKQAFEEERQHAFSLEEHERADALDHQVQWLRIESKRLDENNENLQALKREQELKYRELEAQKDVLQAELESFKSRQVAVKEALTKVNTSYASAIEGVEKEKAYTLALQHQQSLLEKENASLKMPLEIILEKLKSSDTFRMQNAANECQRQELMEQVQEKTLQSEQLRQMEASLNSLAEKLHGQQSQLRSTKNELETVELELAGKKVELENEKLAKPTMIQALVDANALKLKNQRGRLSGFAMVLDGQSERWYPDEYCDSDTWEDDDDPSYHRQPIKDEEWFLAHEIDYPSNDEQARQHTDKSLLANSRQSKKREEDDRSFVKEESYFLGEEFYRQQAAKKEAHRLQPSDSKEQMDQSQAKYLTIYLADIEKDLLNLSWVNHVGNDYDGQLYDAHELSLMASQPAWKGFMYQGNHLEQIDLLSSGYQPGDRQGDGIDEDNYGSVRSGLLVSSDAADVGSEMRASLLGGSSEGDVESVRY
ncbi:hypothetical protein L7F22_002100 [Adiantum nelumboides]|nr:hypothetical protein [Adiantum nelumboides]